MSRRLRLRTVLILVNLFVLALPLAGIQLLRIYESALVRQTESELIAQGEAIASFYRATFERLTEFPGAGFPGLGDFLTRHSLGVVHREMEPAAERWQPRAAMLDLADAQVAAALPEAIAGPRPDPLAEVVGETLTPVLVDLQTATLAGIRVVDFRGIVVASTAADGGLNLAAGHEIRSALAGTGTSQLRQRELVGDAPALSSISRGSRLRVFVSTPIVYQDRVLGAVLLSRTPADILQALYGKRALLLQAAALMLAVVIGIAFLTSRTVAKPLRALSDAARRIAAGDSAALGRLKPAGTEEIAQLGESIYVMGDSLHKRANYLRDFTRHLSHEFKTPLAAIHGAVEVLEDHGQTMDDDRREGFLTNIHADVDRLNRLTIRLQELAQAEVGPGSDNECTDVGAILRPLADEAGVVLGWSISPPLVLAIGADRLTAVIAQLLDNALQHGGANPRIEIGRHGMFGELRFHDDGPGVSAGNRDRVFDAFFTTSRDKGGTGLGLSITRALLEGVGGTVDLVDTNTGAVFQVLIPLANE